MAASPPAAAKPESTKMRDSCNACAVSKIKCSKEKPVCARCTKRGQRCEYLATRRAGRKHEPRPPKPVPSSSSASCAGRDNSQDVDDGSDARSSVQVAISSPTKIAGHFTSESWDVCMTDALAFPSPSDALSNGTTPRLPPEDTAPWGILSSVLLHSRPNDMFATQEPFSEPYASPNRLFKSLSTDNVKETSTNEANPFDDGDFSALLIGDASIILGDGDLDNPEAFEIPATWDPPSSPSLSSPSSLPSSATSNAVTLSHVSARGSPSDERDLSSTVPPAPAAGSPGCCLIRALDLLKTLFPRSASCTCQDAGSATDSHNAQHHQIPTIQHVISENKQTLEAIQAMLQCTCFDADSSYLLAVISLVVFKVLGWYKAAVKDLPGASGDSSTWGDALKPLRRDSTRSDASSRNSALCNRRRMSCHAEQVLQTPAVIDGYRLDGDDQARMSAQLVLSELHRVQRLINVLASRLKRDDAELDLSDAPFFSPAWFGHLEGDLRKRVRTLSHDIVEYLKR
ncbi:aflatoxin regulatory protein-domain-containing protein [Echria macrotheca]|uniref:Aflatoxin regulatory protein-domain-containing protein n=1 Tax=Echria macrotheca TaxID=438768 RepID=A0AAJ0F7N8_9PEZI|nr:aflatoxin regulatory protein-domain-containing protein [Echria macrotheca]